MSDDYDDPSLNIEIRTSADTGGVQDATKAVQGLSDAAGERSGGLTHSLRELSGTSRHTTEIFRGLEGAMSGGARGIGEMVRGFRALIIVSAEAIGATGLGGVIALLAGAGLGAIMAFSKHTHEAAKGLGEAGEKAGDLKSKLEELAKAEEAVFKPLLDQLKEVDEHFKVVESRIAQAKKDAMELENAQKKTADAQAEYNKALSLEEADTPEKKAYIEKKASADKAVADATSQLNTTGQGYLDAELQLHTDQRKAEAQKDAVDAANAEAEKRKQELEKAKKDAPEKIRQSYLDEQKAAEAAEETVGLSSSMLGASGPNVADVARNTQAAKDERKGILAKVWEAKTTSDKANEEAAKANDIAQKQQEKIESDQLEVQNKILVAQQETKEAILKLAAAMIERKNADNAEVTGGGESMEKIEGDAKRSADEKAADEKKTEANQAKIDAHNKKAADNQAAEDLRKAHKKESERQIQTEKEWAAQIRLKMKADEQVHEALHASAKQAIKTAQVIEASSSYGGMS